MHISAFCNLGLTEEQLLTIRGAAQTKLLSGGGEVKNITRLDVPGLGTEFEVIGNPMEVARAATYALQVMSSSVYGYPLVNTVIGIPR